VTAAGSVEIVNKLGLHARAAAKLVAVAGGFQSRVTLAREDGGAPADGKSIMAVLMLGAPRGTRLQLCCEGSDAHEAYAALCELIANRFDEGE
jgi:phosphocarrier protein